MSKMLGCIYQCPSPIVQRGPGKKRHTLFVYFDQKQFYQKTVFDQKQRQRTESLDKKKETDYDL